MLKRFAQATKQYLERGAPGHVSNHFVVRHYGTSQHHMLQFRIQSHLQRNFFSPSRQRTTLPDGARFLIKNLEVNQRLHWHCLRHLLYVVLPLLLACRIFVRKHLLLAAKVYKMQPTQYYVGWCQYKILPMLLLILWRPLMQHVLPFLLYVLVFCKTISSPFQLQLGADV
jgi:hypothetical protein